MTIHAQERLLERFGMHMSFDGLTNLALDCSNGRRGEKLAEHPDGGIVYEVEVDGVRLYPVVGSRRYVVTFLTRTMAETYIKRRPRAHRRKPKYHGPRFKKAEKMWRLDT